ncbi:MAG: alpha-amylase family protein [Pseudomonadota bacterium]
MRQTTLILIAILAILASCYGSGTIAPEPPADWVRVARVGGLSLNPDLEDYEILAFFNDFVKQNVNVIEVDGRLSEYLSDEEFNRELDLMRRCVQLAATKNIKLVWYYPSLESITIDGEYLPSSMYKDHPSWVQLSIDGTVNVFYGSLVFWVEPGEESAWLSPLTEYREYYLNRVRQIAATGIDGLWVDVPLYNDIVGKWTSHTPEERAQFKEDTGYDMPTVADETNPAWWAWIRWRHTIINEFLMDVYAAAKEVNPDFLITVETVTMDYNAALLEGLDGSFTGPLADFWHVWEVDVISDTNSMVNATADDWVSMIAMYQYGRNADRGRAAWAFVYGYEPSDAELVLAEVLAAQCNPYELKVPEMTTSVGADYRKRVFGWILDYEDEIYRSESASRIAVLHSSSSRDYVDGQCVLGGTCGVSLYARWNRPDPNMAWWTDTAQDSIYYSTWMGEYKGMVKALVHLHQPFEVSPSNLATVAILNNYEMIILPDLRAVSDAEAQVIKEYVSGGGQAFFTGPGPGTLDEVAQARAQSAFSDLIDLTTPENSCQETVYGQGQATYCNYALGKSYFDQNSATALVDLRTAMLDYSTTRITTNAPNNVHFALYKTGTQLVLHVVNFTGVDGVFEVEEQTFSVTLDASELTNVSSVKQTNSRITTPQNISFTQTGNQITFELFVDLNALVIIE